ncbi:hypothetical protein DYB38_008923, partial [Aphanomyces astaci]
ARRYDLCPWIKKPYVLSPDKARQIRAYSDDAAAVDSSVVQTFLDSKWIPLLFAKWTQRLVVMRQVNYTDRQVQRSTMDLLDKLSLLDAYMDTPIFAWLNTFNQWRQLRAFLEEKREDGKCQQTRNNADISSV